MFDLALELVRDSPCDPKTLTRAARDHAEREPAFAEGAGLAALRWLSLGFGYEITALDVWSAYHAALKAAEALGHAEETNGQYGVPLSDFSRSAQVGSAQYLRPELGTG